MKKKSLKQNSITPASPAMEKNAVASTEFCNDDKLQILTQKYQAVFEGNDDSIAIIKLNANGKLGSFFEINSATTSLFGYSKEELLAMNYSDINFCSPKKIDKKIEKLISTNKRSFKAFIKTKNGTLKKLKIKFEKINYCNEPAVILFTKDITNKNNPKKNIKNLDYIIKAIPDLIFEVGLNGKIYHYHSGQSELLTMAPELFLRKYIYEVLPPDVVTICTEAIQEANEKGTSNGLQYSLDLNNSKHWFELSVSSINYKKPKAKKRFIIISKDISLRKQAENKQTESLRFLEKITKRLPGILFQFQTFPDGSSCFPYASDGIKELYGLNSEDVANDSSLIFDGIHPEDSPRLFAAIEESAANLTLLQQEYRAVFENDEIKHLFGLASPQLEEDGSVLWHGFVTDITEKKIIAQSLRDSEEKYRNLVENSPNVIVIYSKGKIVFVNDEGVRMIAAKNKKEIIGKSVLDFTHPDSKASILKKMEEVIRDNNASNVVEEKLIDINGKSIYVELKAIPTIYDNQNAVQVIIHDITERKRTQEKINQLSQAVEQSPVTIMITDTSGIIEYVNPKFTETSGYTPKEIIGQSAILLKSPNSPLHEFEQLVKTLSLGKEWFGELHSMKKNGELYWESASISPIVNEKGIKTHYIVIKEDITNRKEVEKQLITAKEKAEESDRLKLAFLTNMSHEIRTPMNGILGFTELLKSPNLSTKKQEEYIQIIEKSGARMLNIINDIISISKIESGQIEVSLSETNVNEQIEYLYDFFNPEAQQKNICFTIHTPLAKNEAYLYTDKEKIYAILTNLVKNALKFTTSGSIDFGYSIKEDVLEFFITDTGFGISEKHKKIIFERFRQANESETRAYEGSGLGLAISKAYVEILGGKIWVNSELGKGSSFHFTIPFSSQNNTKNTTLIEETSLDNHSENEIKNLNVLIVEDDSISKLLVSIAVKPFCKKILKVGTGVDAIETCRNNPDIDFIMMDINMPVMGGFEATKQIRKFNKKIIIIAQTANGMQSDKDEAIAAGCSDYISKPINIADLNKIIQKHFKKAI